MHTIDQAFADRVFHTAIEQMQSDTRGPALTNIRSIRARNRSERERPRMGLVSALSAADRTEIVRNLHDRLQLFAALTHDRAMPDGWAEEFAARAVDMVLALSRGSR